MINIMLKDDWGQETKMFTETHKNGVKDSKGTHKIWPPSPKP